MVRQVSEGVKRLAVVDGSMSTYGSPDLGSDLSYTGI